MLKYQKPTFKSMLTILVWLIIVLTILWLGWCGGKLYGKPVGKIYDPNEIPFPYDPNIAPKVIGWGEINVSTPWSFDFNIWASRDVSINIQTTPSTGSINFISKSDVADSKEKIYHYSLQHAANDLPQLYYYHLVATLPQFPNVKDEAWLILRTKLPDPEILIYTWEPPIPDVILYGSEDTMQARQRLFQEWAKITNVHKIVKTSN